MKNSNSGSRRWAVVTLLFGGTIAYPFLRQSEPALDPDFPDDSAAHPAGAPPARVRTLPDSRLVSGTLPGTKNGDGLSEADAGEFVWEDPRIFEESPQVALPEWVVPASSLDQLIEGGAASAAAEPGAAKLEPLPTWTDSSPPDDRQRRLPTQSSTLADYSQSPWDQPQAPTAASDSPQGPAQHMAGNETEPVDWPDQEIAQRWAQPAETQTGLAGKQSPALPGSLAGRTTSSVESQPVGRAVIRNPGPAKPPAFVYQPGFEPKQ